MKLASSDAALADRSPAAERRHDRAPAGAEAADRSVFVTATPWRAQALRWIGYATGTVTVLWLVALIAGAVGAGRLPAVPFPAIGALHGTQAARQASQPSPPAGIVERRPAATGRGSHAGSLRHAATAPAPAGVRGSAPRGAGRPVPDRLGSHAPNGARRPTEATPSNGSAQPAPTAAQPRASSSPSAPGASSQSVTRGASRTAAKPAAPPGRQTAVSKAPATSRAADPPVTAPGTARRSTTAG